jgi:hypothetical protein
MVVISAPARSVASLRSRLCARPRQARTQLGAASHLEGQHDAALTNARAFALNPISSTIDTAMFCSCADAPAPPIELLEETRPFCAAHRLVRLYGRGRLHAQTVFRGGALAPRVRVARMDLRPNEGNHRSAYRLVLRTPCSSAGRSSLDGRRIDRGQWAFTGALGFSWVRNFVIPAKSRSVRLPQSTRLRGIIGRPRWH